LTLHGQWRKVNPMIEQTSEYSSAIQQRLEVALTELDEHRKGWFKAVQQDAVESFPRLSRWQQTRHGCRVPVMDMVINPLRRNLRLVAESFVADAAVILAHESSRSAPALELAGRGVDLELIVDPVAVDFVFRRGWLQRNVPARRKFEDQMLVHLEAIYQTEVRSHLEQLLYSTLEAMQTCEQQPPNPAVGTTSLGG
jgi:hypothetical protein